MSDDANWLLIALFGWMGYQMFKEWRGKGGGRERVGADEPEASNVKARTSRVKPFVKPPGYYKTTDGSLRHQCGSCAYWRGEHVVNERTDEIYVKVGVAGRCTAKHSQHYRHPQSANHGGQCREHTDRL